MHTPNIFEQIKNSQFTRIILVLFLVLILQIPTAMLQGLVSDRQGLRQEAVSSITTKWGKGQEVIGPRLVVPYIKRIQSGKTLRSEQKQGFFLPDDLKIDTKMDTEVRYRGIYEVPVYQSTINFRGRFQRPDLSSWGVAPEDILWNQAELLLQISDAHAIQNQTTVNWNQKQVPFSPGQGKFGENKQGIHANLGKQMTGEKFEFAIALKLNGSEKIAFAPLGKLTQVKLKSDWNNPSFQGVWLPNTRTVTAQGFDAAWDIPDLGRNYPQQWTTEANVNYLPNIEASVFGVDLISAVDNYRMADRSIKYNFLFLLLTFACLWLFEVTARLRVHPLQYLLMGVAMSMFYLLQLALSEHLGFQAAYLIASVAVVVLITFYAIAVLRAKRRGSVIGMMQIALYTYLFIVLINQDYSLLIGSLGLFLFVAIVMYLTRRIDWFTPSQRRLEPPTSRGEDL
jgi:inner membrane protein